MGKTNTIKKSYLKFIAYSGLDKWYVSYYLNPYVIKSQYPLIELKEVIEPLQKRIKKDDYDGELPVVSKISFKDGKIHLRDENKTGMDLYEMPVNQLLVSKINFHQGALAINESTKLVCSTHYQPYRIDYNKINGQYLVSVLRSNGFLCFLQYLRADGIKNEATYEFIGQLKIPLPSLEEQNRILETYNKRIQLAKQQKQKAKEIQSKISVYVNEALGIKVKKINERGSSNNNSLLKFVKYRFLSKWGADKQISRSVEYLKDFDIKKVSEVCSVSSGGTPNRSIKRYYTGDIPWVKTAEVVNEIIYDTEEKITEDAINNSSAKLYPKGSLIIAMYGQGKTRGRTAKLGVMATTNQACAVLYNINDSIINTDYLWLYFRNEYNRLRELASGNNQPNLNAQMIKDYRVVVPSLKIQNEIANIIEKMKAKIKTLQQQAEENRKLAIEGFEKEIFQ